MAYTIHDTPDVVARVEADLAKAVATVRAGDPYLRALILTGGFARGEGAVLGGVPQNDYDLVAIRGLGPARESYARLRERLEQDLGLHIDLAPIHAWRLRWTRDTIFWYETALRGRVLWGERGEELLRRIPCRDPSSIDPAEGLRLLANRAAGLLLATAGLYDPHIQASKALLASIDAQLLASGSFPPSQGARWAQWTLQQTAHHAPDRGHVVARTASWDWLAWAYHAKVHPDTAPARHPLKAWKAARAAILAAVPVALQAAGMATLEAYGDRDGFADRLVYFRRSASIPGARRFASHPTAHLRVATLRLLEASPDFRVDQQAAEVCLSRLAHVNAEPVPLLDALRQATLQ